MSKFITGILVLFLGSVAFAQVVTTATTGTVTFSQGLGSALVSKVGKYAVVATVTNVAPGAGTFTCAVTDICTRVGHGYATGLVVRGTTTTTLPAGISVSTDYFIISLGANTFSFATTLALAQAGTAIDITDTGTGTHTVTATALAGASLRLQGSMDNTVWVDLPVRASGDVTKSANVTVTASFYLDEPNINVNYIRVFYAITTGQLSVSQVPKYIRLP